MRALDWIMALSILVGTVLPAKAQRPPEVSPSDKHERIALTYDRSVMPGDQILFPARTILAHSYAEGDGYGGVYMVCRSNSDPSHGRCPTADTGEPVGSGSEIPLRFRERRSGLTVELSVRGHLSRIERTQNCFRDWWQPARYPLSSSTSAVCVVDKPVGTGAEITLPSSELAKLVAGRWDATLELTLQREGGRLASYTFTFDLTITDHDRVSIYFPQYDQATPHVGLNVKYNPVGTPSLSGRRDLDMCLYDGLGSQSPYLEISVTDTGRPAPGRPPERFSVWNAAAIGSDERDRLDYTVTLRHAGVPIRMQNGRLEPLNGIDSAELRLVVLPGMALPVYCVPTPLTLEVPRVDASSKTEGYYQGNLTIVLNVPTGTP
ncbi:CblD-like pilus biogenesis initiator [Stenotrophomonas rhizophila]|uniref:CblD-like pilus biogenesis initiator n=2 Tax=Stenotrophomonas rhizophila TaxID=216778 RepID=A0A498CQ52_9GAMM|nr:CblD-like pilus biogenesis initiator [Stenotrophomonas rhizophila]